LFSNEPFAFGLLPLTLKRNKIWYITSQSLIFATLFGSDTNVDQSSAHSSGFDL